MKTTHLEEPGERVRRVVLTGGIATGKSYVLDRFAALGVATPDADQLAHAAQAPDGPAWQALRDHFGAGMFDDQGLLDRPKLGALVFAPPRGIVAIPLFYESPRTQAFHRVIVTACHDETQLARVVARGLTEDEAGQRIRAQLPTPEKVRRADYTIWTDGTHAETDRQVAEILRKLRVALADRQKTRARRQETGD